MLQIHVHLAAVPEAHCALGSTVTPSTLLVIIVLEEEVVSTQVEDTPALLPSLVVWNGEKDKGKKCRRKEKGGKGSKRP